MSGDRQQSQRWARLAAVARERAAEQDRFIADIGDDDIARPHREQRRYLLRLAESYDRQGSTIQSP